MFHDFYHIKYNKGKEYSVVDMNKVNYFNKIDDMIKEGIQQAVYEITNDNTTQIQKKFEAFFTVILKISVSVTSV